MGRPKKLASAKRTAPVLVKFTEDEKAQLVAEAGRLGAPSVVDVIRQRALSGRVVVHQAAELAAPDRVALQRVGVNLNQIARVLNEQGGAAVVGLTDDLRISLAQLNGLLLQGISDDSEPQ